MDARCNRTRLGASLIGAAAMSLLAATAPTLARTDDPPPAPAQAPATQPTRDPAMSNPGVDRMLLEQSRSRLNTDPIDPIASPRASRAIPSVTPPANLVGGGQGGGAGGSSALRPAAVTAEGAVTGLMPGRLYRTTSGELIFAANMASKLTASTSQSSTAGSETALVDERAFVLLPNKTLAQLSGATSNMADGLPLVVSGQAFSYRGTAYLLPLTFSIRRASEPAASKPAASADPAAPQTSPGVATSGAPAADPRVSDLIARLEQNRQPRALDAAMVGATEPANSTSAPAARPAGESEFTPSLLGALAPEGTLVVRSRARLTRPGWAAGRLVVAFDNDPRSPARAPMLVMPSRMLEQAESMAGQLGEDATFLVSGRVTIHEGRNYFLPILVQRLPRGDVRPGQ